MALNRNHSIFSTASTPSFAAKPIDYNISQITPYLFVAGADSAREFSKIFFNGIGCVINVANELPHMIYPAFSGIESWKYPIRDNPAFPAASYFDIVADRIAANVAANRRTLLYCHYGRSRSVTFTLAYLIKHHHLPLQTAFALVKQRRQLASPNVGFWSQLRTYELKQQQTLMPAIFRNFQDSLQYAARTVYQTTNAFGRTMRQFPSGYTFVYARRPPISRPYSSRLIPMIYARPYSLRLPLRTHRPYLMLK